MSDNSVEIVQQIRAQFEALLTQVQVTSGEPPSAYEVEKRLVTDLLELGRLLLTCFFCSQQSALEAVISVEFNGQRLPLHGSRRRSLYSVFGKIVFWRGYFYCNKQGYCLLDARLNLPERSVSDLFREWRSRLACYNPYHKTGKTLNSILGQRPCARAIEDDIERDRHLAEVFYDQHPVPVPSSEASILVAQADGKGVPMLGEKQEKGRVRLSKGDKASRKKEAIATSVYTIEPCIRTPTQVTDSLFMTAPPGQQDEAPVSDGSTKRKGPQNKWLWATFVGKSGAIEFAKKQITRREGEHITSRVALADGSAPLQFHMVKHLPDFTLILDIIHAIEYMWTAANRLFGEKSPKREAWVRERVELILSGGAQQIIDEFEKLASEPDCRKSARIALKETISYYKRNLPYMRYDVYLAKGWPIGTGVIEGACRHLIKDRCELSGMRWTISGAEGLLHSRSIAENDDWDHFEEFRRAKRKAELYGKILQIEKSATIELAAIQASAVATEYKAA